MGILSGSLALAQGLVDGLTLIEERQEIERSQDAAIYRTIRSYTAPDDRTVTTMNQFTLLENALHYHEAGEWKTSEDVIETYPTGAVALRGPHMLCGFSGSRASEYIGAFWYGRLANGTVPEPITIVQSGRNPATASSSAHWGDYSHTTLDPDGTTIWTVQEFASYYQGEGPIWSTWISSVGVAP